MNLPAILPTISGPVLFESITSLDNAVINTEVLSDMPQRKCRPASSIEAIACAGYSLLKIA